MMECGGTAGEVVVVVSYSHYQAERGVGDAADSKRRTGGEEKNTHTHTQNEL